MKKHRNIILVLLILVTSFWGCEDILDQELRHSLSAEDAAQTAKGSEAILSGAILAGRSTFSGTELSGLGITVYRPCGTDIVRSGTNLVDEAADLMPALNTYSVSLSAVSTAVEDIWNIHYNGITLVNQVIDGFSDTPVEELTDEIRDKLGQAYTMRAFLYLELVRRYENIPIIEAVDLDLGPVFETEQKTPAEVYDLIIADLETAIPLMLPRVGTDGDRGVLIPSQGLANLLLAEASLDVGNYQRAADAADAVIADPSYMLQPLDGIFGLDGGKTGEESNPEILFSFGFTEEIPEEVQWTSQQFMPLYDRLNGVARTMAGGGRPWSRLSPSEYYWSLFEEEDGRLDAWHKLNWVFDDPDNVPEGRELGDIVTMDDAINQYGEGAVGLRYIEPTTWKYAEDDTYGRNTSLAEGWRNIIMFRLANAYISGAEAHFQNGNTGMAMQYLNTLRERAYGSVAGNFSSITFEDIVEEHARELGHEGHRWYFLKRNNLLVERVAMHNVDAAPNIQESHVRWPIPLTFIDQTGSTQNPGY